MKLPGVSGVYDYAGPTRDSRYRPRRVAFHQVKSVGVLIASFRSSIPSPRVPLFTLRRTPHDVQRKTRGRVVRYSFLVGLLHSLLHAGLSRRTDSAISRQRTTVSEFLRRVMGERALNHGATWWKETWGTEHHFLRASASASQPRRNISTGMLDR